MQNNLSEKFGNRKKMDAAKGRITLGKAVIKINLMEPDMADFAVQQAEGGLETSFDERRIA